MARIRPSLRDAHPSSPWLWREDWASGRIRSSHGLLAIVACGVAVVFTGLSTPVVLNAATILEEEGIEAALLMSLFPLAALGLCYWAGREWIRWLRFRDTLLELETLPGVVGGSLRAIVHTGKLLAPADGFTARLSCQKQSRSGNETHSTTIWQHELSIPNARLHRGPFGTAVPVAFEIPFESEPTRADPSGLPSVEWRIEVEAELEGADFRAVFEVPVFKTDASSAEISERFVPGTSPYADFGDASGFGDDSTESLDDARIMIARAPDGSLEIHLPASRNRLGAFVLTAFAVFWNGFIYFAGRSFSGLFAIFLAPFVLVGLGLAILVPFVWLQSTTIRARTGLLVIDQRVFGRGSAREYPIEDIQAIAPKASGMHGTRTNWSVQIQMKHQRRSRGAVLNLRSKADAQRIAAMLMRAISTPEQGFDADR